MYFKKPWSDGLSHDFDHLDEFEAKFHCFGGDGGDNSGGGSSPPTTTTAPEPERRQRVMADDMSTITNADMGLNTVPDFGSVSAFNDFNVPPQSDPAFDMPVQRSPAFDMPVNNNPTLASYTVEPPATSSGIGSLPSIGDLTVDVPVTASQAYSQARDLNVKDLANRLGIPTSFDVGGYNVGLGSTPGVSGIAGLTTDLGPGTVGIGTNLQGNRFGVGYKMNFKDGGVVSLSEKPLPRVLAKNFAR